MSTKSTIHDEDGKFHLYREHSFDPGLWLSVPADKAFYDAGLLGIMECHVMISDEILKTVAEHYAKTKGLRFAFDPYSAVNEPADEIGEVTK